MNWASGAPTSGHKSKSFLRSFFSKKLLLPFFYLPAMAFAGTPDITVEKPWIRYLLPSIPAAGYMVLHNTSASDEVLAAAASPACGMIMLHQSKDDSGMAMMMTVQSVTIPAHGSVTFGPGGLHLMCMQPGMHTGADVKVTLTFQDGSSLAVEMPVYGAQDAP